MEKRKTFNYGWAIVLYGALVMSTLHYTCYNSFGLFVVPITEDLGISRAALSLTMTIGSVAGLFLSPIAGNLLAYKDIRKYMFFGILISGLCIFGEGFAANVYQLYALTLVLQAASTFALALPFSILMLRWFNENRSLATSIIFVGVSMGGVLFASPLTSLIMAKGWRTAYIVIGLVIMCIDAPLCLLIVKNYPKKTAARKETSTPDGKMTRAKHVQAEESSPTQVTCFYRERRFWLLTAGLVCNSFCCVALYHIPAFIQSLGYTAELAAKMVSFYSLINVFGKIIMGILFDRFGLRAGTFLGIIGTVGCYVFMIVAALMPGGIWLAIFSFMFGIGLATQSMFAPSLIGGIYEQKQYSVVYGRISVFTLLASAISNPAISAVYDVTGSYLIAWILCTIVAVLCGVCLMRACQMAGKRSQSESV